MLAIGAGGLEVALAMAGRPFYVKMPEIWGVELAGELPDWVSAKDVILEMLRRHGVRRRDRPDHRVSRAWPRGLSAMDRHVIANMGAELGATTTVFPSDDEVRRFLRARGARSDWIELVADGADYDVPRDRPLDARAADRAALEPRQRGARARGRRTARSTRSYIGSSANPGYRDFAVAAEIVRGRQVHDRRLLRRQPDVPADPREPGPGRSSPVDLIHAGARIHQAGCNGCIGMGQAPASGRISLRTVPRNFPGRSGTREDKVYLVSPETAAASALTGVITDPRGLDIAYPRIADPCRAAASTPRCSCRPCLPEARQVELERGPNIARCPSSMPLPDGLAVPVAAQGRRRHLHRRDHAGRRAGTALPQQHPEDQRVRLRHGRPELPGPGHGRAGTGGHVVVGGATTARARAASMRRLAPRYLGLRAVIAQGFARIHWQNLVNFGVLPLTLADASEYDRIEMGDVLKLRAIRRQIREGRQIEAENMTRRHVFSLHHELSGRQVDVLLAGGLINWMREELVAGGPGFSGSGGSAGDE